MNEHNYVVAIYKYDDTNDKIFNDKLRHSSNKHSPVKAMQLFGVCVYYAAAALQETITRVFVANTT